MPASIALINTVPQGRIHPPLGLVYLASYLHHSLPDVKITIVDQVKNRVRETVALKPDIIGITCMSHNFNATTRMLKDIRQGFSEHAQPFCILGGPHITSVPHTLPREFDVGVIGEGEETLLELVTRFLDKGVLSAADFARIPGLCYHDNGGVRLSEKREQIQNLDDIPIPEWDYLDLAHYLKPAEVLYSGKNFRALTLSTSRGCKYRCAFCSRPVLWGKMRYHSVRRVVDEIQLMKQRYNVEAIDIIDDLFTSSEERIEEITNELERRRLLDTIKFHIDAKPSEITDNLARLIRRMGVICVSLGIETVSDKLLTFIGKGTDKACCQKAVDILATHNIPTRAYFILGLPTETQDDLKMTLSYIRRNSFQTITLGIFTPFPGAALWKYLDSKGLLPTEINWDKITNSPKGDINDFYYYNDDFVPRPLFERYLRRFRVETFIANSFHSLNEGIVTKVSKGLRHPLVAARRFCQMIRAD